jgi:hypothetical protein
MSGAIEDSILNRPKLNILISRDNSSVKTKNGHVTWQAPSRRFP